MELLPSEVLTSLLIKLGHIPSIINFSIASKKYYQFIHNNDNNNNQYQQILWKNLFLQQQILDPSFYKYSPPSIGPNNTNTNTHQKKQTDWRAIVRQAHCLKQNWKYGRAVPSTLPGIHPRLAEEAKQLLPLCLEKL